MSNEQKNIMLNPLSQNTGNDNPDAILIQHALDGNRKSLEQLVADHQPWIYNIAFKMIMDHDDAADITQEILIKIITNLASYNPDRGNFRTWAYRIVVNHVLNMKKGSLKRGSMTSTATLPPLKIFRMTAHLRIPTRAFWPKKSKPAA